MRLASVKNTALPKGTREFDAALNKKLAPDDQFNSFVTLVTIAPGEETMIFNHLSDGRGRRIIPGEWAVIDVVGAPQGALTRGPTAWTVDQLYLKNTSEDTGRFKIRFMARQRPGNEDDILAGPALTATLAAATVVSGIATVTFVADPTETVTVMDPTVRSDSIIVAGLYAVNGDDLSNLELEEFSVYTGNIVPNTSFDIIVVNSDVSGGASGDYHIAYIRT
jgi:hypothetical protein